MQGDKTEKQSTQNSLVSSAQTGRLTPFAPTNDIISRLLSSLGSTPTGLSGAESGALDSLTAMGQRGSQFTPAITGVANTLLSGGGPDRTGIVSTAYDDIQKALAPTARGDFLDPSKNPFFADTTAAIGNDVTNRIMSIYQGSGRDPSGAGNLGYTLGKGIGEATAPVFAGVYTGERGNQLGAISSLFGAGGSTASLLSGLDQTRLGNMQAGIGAADAATSAEMSGPMMVLQAEAQRRGIPLDSLARELGLVLPVAQTFGTQTSTGTQTGQATGTETTTTKKDPLSQILGAAIGGAGLVGGLGGFGQNGWLYGSGGGGLLNGMGSRLFSGASNGFYPGRY